MVICVFERFFGLFFGIVFNRIFYDDENVFFASFVLDGRY